MNYYKKIAEMLGVELGEEFNLKQNKTKDIIRPRYKITQEGLMYSVNRNKFARSTILLSIINGSYSVVKLQWKPKHGDRFWYYSEVFEEVVSLDWEDCYHNFLLWKVGNCFKTKEEADAKGKEIMEKIQKEYEEA